MKILGEKMKSILFLVIFIFLLLISCNEPTGGGDDEPGVYITVVDSISGQPIDSAIVRVYYTQKNIKSDTNYLCNNAPNPFPNTTRLMFEVRETQNYLIEIIKQDTGEILDTLFNDVLEVGFIGISWGFHDSLNDKYKDGFYTFRMKYGETVLNYECLLSRFYYYKAETPLSVPIKVYLTSNKGRADVKPEDVPWIGKKYRRIHEQVNILGDKLFDYFVYIEILKDNYKTDYRVISFDKNSVKKETVKLVRK